MVTGLNTLTLIRALTALGELLESQPDTYELVVIGGASMLLSGASERATADVDVLGHLLIDRVEVASPLPASIVSASSDVARALGLRTGWFGDDRTRGLLDQPLPAGFVERLRPMPFGSKLTLHLAGRLDLICLKLSAASTIGVGDSASKHLADLLLLAPTEGELDFAAAWCSSHFVPGDRHRKDVRDVRTWLQERRP